MKICEIFKSLQGEGRNQGRPCIFIRLAGCNLDCAWCDTPHAKEEGKEAEIDAILDYAWRLTGDHFCITGGEPLLQGEELLPLIRRLHMASKTVEIETNGTVDFRPFQRFASICMDVKCPSSGEKSNLTLLEFIRSEDSVKFVVADERDCAYARKILARFPVRGEVFISPVEGSDAGAIAKFLITYNIPARFQLQLHKCIGVK
ncbi:MAG: radical SAM protein [Methanomicrobiaceae archaeon]|nr:radical SAM protein [Methanomicrobiaceae archaeon]